jgi:outer membrane protein OmpA-like peptidoglycan-associated protein
MRTFLFYIILIACWLPAQSQQIVKSKSTLQLADQYFAAGEYYTAAYLYEQFLNPTAQHKKQAAFPVYTKKGTTTGNQNKLRTDILYKQANSYRLANYYALADSAYKKCTDHIDALYWSAVCERSLGKYDQAEENIRKYLGTEGIARKYVEEAEQEWAILEFIRAQLSRADSILMHVKKLSTPNSFERGVYAVAYVSDQQYLVNSTRTDSAAAKKVNPHHSRLFYATLNNDSLLMVTPVTLPAAGTPVNQGAAAISADGRRMYFTQWEKENGHIAADIYYSNKLSDNTWSAPVSLQVNTTGYNSKQPFVTADGKFLFFASDRPGGSGGFDIWYAPLNRDGSTSAAVNAGSVINTAANEQAPFYHAGSGTLVFATNGRLGMGGYDLFAAKGNATTWSEPANLGHPFNSSRDDIYFFAPENEALLANAVIGSDRGEGCCIETYRITKSPKGKLLTGLVVDCKNSGPVADAVVVLISLLGETVETKTNMEGKYVFEAIDSSWSGYKIAISNPSYKDTMAVVKIDHTDETNLLIDQFVNKELCVEKKFVLKAENVVTVFFDFDRSSLSAETTHKLDSIYNILTQLPSATLQISGYTDGKGSVEYNKKLSDKRARATAQYLIKKGIAASRITFESFGACCPAEMELIDGRDNPDGRSKNRRALINIVRE